jgi:hypothetical protein
MTHQGFKVIECHVQGTTKHCMSNIEEFLKKHGRMNQLGK